MGLRSGAIVCVLLACAFAAVCSAVSGASTEGAGAGLSSCEKYTACLSKCSATNDLQHDCAEECQKDRCSAVSLENEGIVEKISKFLWGNAKESMESKAAFPNPARETVERLRGVGSAPPRDSKKKDL